MSESNWLYEYTKAKTEASGQRQFKLADFVKPFIEQNKDVMISGEGSSMLPTIDRDCMLQMSPIPDSGIKIGDVLLYVRSNGRTVIHRVWKLSDQCYDMVGDNQFWVEKNVPKSAVIAYCTKLIDARGNQKKVRISKIHMCWHRFRCLVRIFKEKLKRHIG